MKDEVTHGSPLKIGVLGGTGFTAAESLRILSGHPRVEIRTVASLSHAGEELGRFVPGVSRILGLRLSSFDSLTEDLDLVISCLPGGVSMEFVPQLVDRGIRVIDHGPDFRLPTTVYEEWYGREQKRSDLVEKAACGLPEIFRDKIRDADLVSVPGCYSTAIILATAPLLHRKIAKPQILAEAQSGITGAGHRPKEKSHYCNLAENIQPDPEYEMGAHRHVPEIEGVLSLIAERPVKASLTTFLAPAKRGILASVYLDPIEGISTDQLNKVCRSFYEDEFFVKVLPQDLKPQTKNVVGTNFCEISVRYLDRIDKVVTMAAIDNMGKGASGQAIQCANIIGNFPEDTGLTLPPLIP